METFKDFYAYTAEFETLTSGSTQTFNINIEADSDFMINKITQFASIASAAQTDSSRVIPLVTMQLKDTGSGRTMFDRAIPLSTVTGEGDLPFILPVAMFLKAKSSLQVTVTNFSAATDYDKLYIVFSGGKIFS